MAFASVGTLSAGSVKTANSFLTSPGLTASVGDLLVIAIAKDNAATADGNTTEFTSPATDTQGNTWTRAREFCNSRGAADGGVTVAIFYSVLTAALTSGAGDTVTINFSDTRTAKADSVWRFTIGAGNSVSVADGTNVADVGADPSSLSLSGLASGEYLFFRAIGKEGVTGTFTQTTNYTPITQAGTSGAGAATNISVCGEFRIVTGTGETSNPTWTTSAVDHASVFVAFKEVSGSTPLTQSCSDDLNAAF